MDVKCSFLYLCKVSLDWKKNVIAWYIVSFKTVTFSKKVLENNTKLFRLNKLSKATTLFHYPILNFAADHIFTFNKKGVREVKTFHGKRGRGGGPVPFSKYDLCELRRIPAKLFKFSGKFGFLNMQIRNDFQNIIFL